MRRVVLLLVVVTVLLLTGCSSNYNNVQHVGIKNLELAPLTSSEYEIVKDITGTATVKSFLIFRIEGENNFGFLSSTLPLKSDYDLAKSNAIFNAINSNDEIDALLCPKFIKETNGIPFLYNETTVTVKGKGIKIIK
ncbi:MAG: hypothetical protein K9J13_11780 [Saprospiraceae bacterium]|nr:hypothetical protein [Saprospiraceae bacterium]